MRTGCGSVPARQVKSHRLPGTRVQPQAWPGPGQGGGGLQGIDHVDQALQPAYVQSYGNVFSLTLALAEGTFSMFRRARAWLNGPVLTNKTHRLMNGYGYPWFM